MRSKLQQHGSIIWQQNTVRANGGTKKRLLEQKTNIKKDPSEHINGNFFCTLFLGGFSLDVKN